MSWETVSVPPVTAANATAIIGKRQINANSHATTRKARGAVGARRIAASEMLVRVKGGLAANALFIQVFHSGFQPKGHGRTTRPPYGDPASPLVVAALVLNHQPILGQAARCHHLNHTFQLERFDHARRIGVCIPTVAFHLHRHRILLPLPAGNHPHTGHFVMARRKGRHLFGPHKHPLDLGRLIGSTHPAFDPHIRPTTGALPRHHSAHIARGKTDQRVVRVQRRHNHFAHLTRCHRVAGARRHDLDNDALVHDHPLHRRSFISDIAQIRRGIGLQAGNAPVRIFLAQRRKQRPATNSRLGKGQRDAHLIRLVENDLEVVGRARIGRGANVARRRHLQFGLARACRENRSPHSPRPAFKNHPGGR
mmetsp:Transcript_23540/g.41601  ORF Transcript_23540/g.41601 Transcript_23540/m.41601 type:complete len:366 (-) Transcript_23540:4288-5385(-)